jgi:hypothetical protein
VPSGVETYGLLNLPSNVRQVEIELMLAFNRRLFAATGWQGRLFHLKNAIDLIWNVPRRQHAAARGQAYDERKHDAYIWNEWSENMQRLFCDHPGRTITGPHASGKTTSAAVYHLCAFYAAPTNTIVVLTSTTLPGLRKRIWKEILRYHRLANPGFGHVAAADYAIRFQKGSDESGIFGIATGQNDGDVKTAVEKIIGFHAANAYAMVDEMQATNEAIVTASISLRAGTDNFEFTGLGNADSELDSHGQASEPIEGWDSITVESDFWLTKRGACLHLDGPESPRIKEGDDFYPGLMTRRDIEDTKKEYGEDSPDFWQRIRGYWAPQGVQKIVLTPAIVNKGRAKEKAIWTGEFMLGAALDPAFEGGDRCALRIGKVGEFAETGVIGMELCDKIIIKISASDPLPLHYQIVEQVSEILLQRSIPWDMFAMDSTGEGGGLASIFMREKSSAFLPVEFGGRASAMIIRPKSDINPTPKLARDEYVNRRTELWYAFRTVVQNGQVRGLDHETMVEFCQCRYKMQGNLRILESKADMKARIRRSPDLADATVVLTELFRRRGLLDDPESAGQEKQGDDWQELARRYDVASDPENYLVEA